MTKEKTQHKGLCEALAAFQAEAPMIIKSADNPFYKSKYADLPAVWGTVQSLMNNHGLLVTNSVSYNPIAGRDELTTIVEHVASKESRSSVLPINPVKHDPQGYGAAITYHRRQNIVALLGLVCDDDDDGNEASQPVKAPAKPAAKSAEKKDTLREFFSLLKKELGEAYEVESLKYIFEKIEGDTKILGHKFSDLPEAGQKALRDLYDKRLEALEE